MCDFRVSDTVYKIVKTYDYNTNQYLRKVDETTMYVIMGLRDESADWHCGFDYTFIATLQDVRDINPPEEYIIQLSLIHI